MAPLVDRRPATLEEISFATSRRGKTPHNPRTEQHPEETDQLVEALKTGPQTRVYVGPRANVEALEDANRLRPQFRRRGVTVQINQQNLPVIPGELDKQSKLIITLSTKDQALP